MLLLIFNESADYWCN